MEERNQKFKTDAGKAPLSLVPPQIIYDISWVRAFGNGKYPEGGKDNWKQVEADRYKDAALRHLFSYIRDPYGVDEESGLPHLWHLAANVSFLCEFEKDIYKKLVPEPGYTLSQHLNEIVREKDLIVRMKGDQR